jgi:hypothetical protein
MPPPTHTYWLGCACMYKRPKGAAAALWSQLDGNIPPLVAGAGHGAA